MADGEKTIKVSASAYDAMMQMRELLKSHGFDALPAQYVAAAEEEIASFKSDDAFPRAVVQSIAARIGLAVMRAHLGVDEPKKAKR